MSESLAAHPTDPTAADSPQPEPAAGLAALTAEVATEVEYPDGTVAVPLAGTTVRILPPEEWTSGAQQDLSTGRFDDWAADCLAGEDYDDVWCELNNGRGPKLREVNAMFHAWTEITGQDRGKSAGSRAFSRRIRHR